MTYTFYLLEAMDNHKKLKNMVSLKVLTLAVMIQLVMILRVTMIWTQNVFWYMRNQVGWLFFTILYQLLANICPLFVFIVVVIQLIRIPEANKRPVNDSSHEVP